MQLLGPVWTSVLALALICLVRAQDQTTAFPESTTYFDVTSGDLTTTNEELTTVDATEPGFRSAETETADSNEQATTVEQQSTTESAVDGEATDVTSGEDVTSTTPAAEEEAKKEHLPDVAETSTAATPERKPVKEPPFIKKYWPLLCLATKCDRRGNAPAPVIPSPDAPEVRSDLEESRSANSGEAEDDSSSAEVLKTGSDSRTSTKVLKALEEQMMLGDQPATGSTQTTDKSTETTRFSSDESSEEESNVTNKPEATTAKSSQEDEDKDEKDNDDDDDDDDDKKKDDD